MKATLGKRELKFGYNTSYLGDILSYYAALVFKDDVLDGKAIPLVATLAT